MCIKNGSLGTPEGPANPEDFHAPFFLSPSVIPDACPRSPITNVEDRL